jgi:hypothetical protein
MILLVAMLATPAFAHSKTHVVLAPTSAPIRLPASIDVEVSADADQYASRETTSQLQADFKGGDGVIVGITLTTTAILAIILLLVLL